MYEGNIVKMSMKLEGWDGLAKALKAMPDDLMIKTIRPAMKKSAQIIADDMKNLAPVRDGGYIRKSIFVYSDQSKQFRKWARFNPKQFTSYIIGPLKPVVPVDNTGRVVGGMSTRFAKRSGVKLWRPFYAIFFEKGTYPHTIVAKRKSILASDNVKYTVWRKKWTQSTGKGSVINRRAQTGTGWTFFGKGVDVSGIRAKPFVRPAFDKNVEKVIKDMGSNLRIGIDKTMREYARAKG